MKKFVLGILSGVAGTLLVVIAIHYWNASRAAWPPEPVIGMMQKYNNYENGSIPTSFLSKQPYDGQWVHYVSGSVSMGGSYRHGYPSNTWFFLANGGSDIRFLEIFKDRNHSVVFHFSETSPWIIESCTDYEITYEQGKVIRKPLDKK